MDVSDLVFVLAMLSFLAGVVLMVLTVAGPVIAVASGLLNLAIFLAFAGWSLHKDKGGGS